MSAAMPAGDWPQRGIWSDTGLGWLPPLNDRCFCPRLLLYDPTPPFDIAAAIKWHEELSAFIDLSDYIGQELANGIYEAYE